MVWTQSRAVMVALATVAGASLVALGGSPVARAQTPEGPGASTAAPGSGAETSAEAGNPGERGARAAEGAGAGAGVRLSLLGALGVAMQESVDDAPFGGGRFGVAVNLGYGLELGGAFGYRYFRPTYTVRGPTVQGAMSYDQAHPVEHQLDGTLEISYNVLQEVTDALWLRMGVAPRFTQWLADGYSTWLFAPEAVGRIGGSLGAARRVTLDAGFGFSASVAAPKTTPSNDGLPRYVYDFGAGVTVALTEGGLASLVLRYEGTAVVYEWTTRLYHGATGGIQFAF